MLQKLMLNKIFMRQWRSERIPTHHAMFLHAKTFCLSVEILSCRGSKCKYFNGSSLVLSQRLSGASESESPEIKKRGTGESNHFSTSSLPDLSLLTCAPVREKKTTPQYDKYIWDVKDAFRPHSLSAAWMLHCSILSLAFGQCSIQPQLWSTNENKLYLNKSPSALSDSGVRCLLN